MVHLVLMYSLREWSHSQAPNELNMILNPHVRDETLRLREVIGHAQGHTAYQCQRQDLNPGMWMTSLFSCTDAPCSDWVQTWVASFFSYCWHYYRWPSFTCPPKHCPPLPNPCPFMAGNGHFRKQMLNIEAMISFLFYGSWSAQYSDPRPQFSAWSQGNGLILGNPIGFRAPFWHHSLWCFMDWGKQDPDKSMDPLTVDHS